MFGNRICDRNDDPRSSTVTPSPRWFGYVHRGEGRRERREDEERKRRREGR